MEFLERVSIHSKAQTKKEDERESEEHIQHSHLEVRNELTQRSLISRRSLGSYRREYRERVRDGFQGRRRECGWSETPELID